MVKSINYNHTNYTKILVNWFRKHWYSVVNLCDNGSTNKLVHRLVAQHFIPNPNNLPCVCHKYETLDENGFLYNWEDNLFWGTYSDNMKDMHKKLRWSKFFSENHPKPNKWKFWNDHPRSKIINQMDMNWNTIQCWGSIIDASTNLWISSISACCRWKRKTAGGFIWKYKDK